MKEVSIIGVDLRSRSFSFTGRQPRAKSCSARGCLRAVLAFMQTHRRCTVAMEACATAHHWARTLTEKLRIVEETLQNGTSISVVACRNSMASYMLYRWRRLMLDGETVAVSEDEVVTSNGAVRQMEDRIHELECQLGRKTLEVEILKEALYKSRSKNGLGSRSRG